MGSILLIILIYLSLAVVYIFILSVFSLLPSKKYKRIQEKYHRFAIIIPNYRENRIILDVAKAAKTHNYPKELFDVYVVADGVQPSTIDALKDLDVNVLEVQFENSTKAKSLNAALNAIEDGLYDYAVVLDVDNIMGQDFLLKINEMINCGFKVVQGHRTAKNTNTNSAFLDAISEESANSILRRGLFRAGGSAMIIGSAFAIEWSLFKRLMAEISDVAGEDRELEIRLLKEKVKIAYCDEAIVYDEKVENWEIYTRQRSRWAAAHLDFVLKYTVKGFAELLRGNLDYFNKVWHNLIPPRIILIGILFAFAIISLIFRSFPYTNYWIFLLLIYIFAIAISIPRKFYNKQMLRALVSIPRMFILMIISWFNAKGQRNKFVSTPHTYLGEKD